MTIPSYLLAIGIGSRTSRSGGQERNASLSYQQLLEWGALQSVGANLTTDSFVKTMDSITIPKDMFGGPELTFTAKKRLGNEQSRMSQITDGKWKVVSEYIK